MVKSSALSFLGPPFYIIVRCRPPYSPLRLFAPSPLFLRHSISPFSPPSPPPPFARLPLLRSLLGSLSSWNFSRVPLLLPSLSFAFGVLFRFLFGAGFLALDFVPRFVSPFCPLLMPFLLPPLAPRSPRPFAAAPSVSIIVLQLYPILGPYCIPMLLPPFWAPI